MIFKPVVRYPPKGGKDGLRKRLRTDLAAASVLLQGTECRQEAGRETLFCLHRGKKRELLCYNLVTTVALLPLASF